MANRVTWGPTGDARTVSFLLQVADTVSGPWSDVATVSAMAAPSNPQYDEGRNEFFYVDNLRDADVFYRIYSVDAVGGRSQPSAPFGVAPVPPVTGPFIVNIVVRSDALVPQPIPDVIVSLVSTAPFALAARATSDALGIAGFSVPGGEYEVRAFKMGVLFSVARIQVTESGTYDLSGTLMVFPPATDPRVCRCTGRFLTFENRPIADMLVYVTQARDLKQKTPKLVDGNHVTPAKMEFRTDKNGYVTMDLYRTGEFLITFAGEEDEVWNFKVPDRPSANLLDLMYPYPLSFEWSEDAVSVGVNQTTEVQVDVVFSDGIVRPADVPSCFLIEVVDGAIADATYSGTTGILSIKGSAAGVTEITATLKDGLFPNRLPTLSVPVTPLAVTVTP